MDSTLRPNGWRFLSLDRSTNVLGFEFEMRAFGFGNLMTRYFAARLVAYLAGAAFNVSGLTQAWHVEPGYPDPHWMKRLPFYVPATSEYRNDTQLKSVCTREVPFNENYPHLSPFVWDKPFMYPIIGPEIRKAIKEHLEFMNLTMPVMDKDTTVIQFRCEAATVLQHPEFGMPEYNFYDTMPADVKKILIVGMKLIPQCELLLNSLKRYLAGFRPNAAISYQNNEAIEYDLATLMEAHTLFVPYSTFGITAMLGNSHKVTTAWAMKVAGLPSWKNADVRYITPAVAASLGIGSVDGIIQHLEKTAGMKPV
jgi:hypothetical protein